MLVLVVEVFIQKVPLSYLPNYRKFETSGGMESSVDYVMFCSIYFGLMSILCVSVHYIKYQGYYINIRDPHIILFPFISVFNICQGSLNFLVHGPDRLFHTENQFHNLHLKIVF